MPVEIRELHIRVAVNAESAKTSSSATSSSASDAGADREATVAECVEQVVQIIQARRER